MSTMLMLKLTKLPLKLYGVIAVLLAVAGACGVYLAAPDRDNTVQIASLLPSGIPAISKATKREPVVVLCDQESGGSDDSEDFFFVLANPMDVPLQYFGYTPESYSPRPARGDINPIAQVEFDEQGQWVRRVRGLCGNGLATLSVRPGEAGRFRVSLPVPHEAVRIGIGCSWKEKDGVKAGAIIWAPEIPATP
jgi:hypothetical protein